MVRFGYVALLLSIFSAECLDTVQSAVRLQQAQNTLRNRLQSLDPQQQQDLAVVVPLLKKGDKAAFKSSLSTMVQNGGNERIKQCLQGLTAIGFDALEIQHWMTSEGAPTPQSKMVPQSAAKETPSQPAALRTVAKESKPAQPVAPPVPAVGAMAGLAAEHQLAEGKQAQTQQKGEEQAHFLVDGAHTKAQEKKALRKELARRLAKGVQAFSRVETVEKEEATIQQQLAADTGRVSQLEKELKQEEQKEAEVAKENSELKHELDEQAALNKKSLARLDALEAKEAGGASDSRVAALEEQNAKFRAALAGAARRLINLEADVTTQKQVASPDGPKVVRHEKKPMQSA